MINQLYLQHMYKWHLSLSRYDTKGYLYGIRCYMFLVSVIAFASKITTIFIISCFNLLEANTHLGEMSLRVYGLLEQNGVQHFQFFYQNFLLAFSFQPLWTVAIFARAFPQPVVRYFTRVSELFWDEKSVFTNFVWIWVIYKFDPATCNVLLGSKRYNKTHSSTL